MRRTERSCPTMRVPSFSSNSCARGLFWSGSRMTVFGVVVGFSISAIMLVLLCRSVRPGKPFCFGAAPVGCGTLGAAPPTPLHAKNEDRKSTRLNSSHANISYAVFCLKKKQQYPMNVRSAAHATGRKAPDDRADDL